MRLPRDVGGDDLARRLEKVGYKVTRQAGSHLRLTNDAEEKHDITIPKHKELKLGTLSHILLDVAKNLGISKKELISRIF